VKADTLVSVALVVGFVLAVLAAILSPWVIYGDPRCVVAQCRIEVAK
jgi:uncharacterized sodium:solute symporter family permease YidK